MVEYIIYLEDIIRLIIYYMISASVTKISTQTNPKTHTCMHN